MTTIAHALSTALLHFVWQGMLAAVSLWTALLLLRKRSANARYVASCATLAVLTLLPVVTVCVVYTRPVAPRTGVDLVRTAAVFLTNPSAQRIDWLAAIQTWALPVWSCGVLLFSLRLLWGCRQVATLRRSGEPAQDGLAAMAASLAARMRVTRPVRVLISSVADGPSVVGWLRPLILLPAATLLGLSAEQLEAVLAHELAHIRRYDYLVNILQMLVETLFFYHPAVWWISNRIRHERELCCDDAAVRCCGDAVCYARALTTLERLRVMTPALALGVTDGPLMYRVQRLLGATTREYAPSRLPAALAICLAAVCFGLNMNRARAQGPIVQDRPGVTVDLRGSSLMHGAPVTYPETAQRKGVQGTVTVEVTLDESGNVSDAHVLSGPEEFRKTVLQSVLTWHFEPDAAGSRRQVNVNFQTPPAGPPERSARPASIPELTSLTWVKGTHTYKFGGDRSKGSLDSDDELRERIAQSEARIDMLKRQQVDASDIGRSQLQEAIEKSLVGLANLESELTGGSRFAGKMLDVINTVGFSDHERAAILSRLPIREGDTLSNASIEAARKAVEDFDEHARAALQLMPGGKLAFNVQVAGGVR